MDKNGVKWKVGLLDEYNKTMNYECVDNESVAGVEVGVLDYILLEHLLCDRGPDTTWECSAGDDLQQRWFRFTKSDSFIKSWSIVLKI